MRANVSREGPDNTGSSAREQQPALVFARIPRLLRYAATEWLVIGCTWVALWYGPAWLYVLGLPILVGRFHALGVVLHDACHMDRRVRGAGVWLLQLLAGYPIATTLQAMRYHHLRHHRFSGMPLDPYLKLGISQSLRRRNVRRLVGLLLVPFWIVRCFFGTLTLFVPPWRTAYGRVFLQDRSQQDLTDSAEIRECLSAEPLQAGFFVLAGLAAWAAPIPVLSFYLIPLLLAGAVNVHRVTVEHIHVACADARPETVAATTVTHAGRFWEPLLLFPRNIGFHLVHHLYPRAALECLPALHAWYVMREVHEARRAAT